MYPPDIDIRQSFIRGLQLDVMGSVMELFDGDDLIRLRHVSRLTEAHVIATIHGRSRALFAGAISDYGRLVDTLDQNDAVIGAAGAVYILFPTVTVPAYFHIYTPHDRFSEVVAYFVHHEGFKAEHRVLALTEGGEDGFAEGVANIIRLKKGTITIDAVQSTNHSPVFPIASQLHTGYFNYVSTRSYGSAYPSLTCERRALLNPARLMDSGTVAKPYREECEAWRMDGWILQVEWQAWAREGVCTGVESLGCASALRAFGDRFSFRGSTAPVRGRAGDPPTRIESFTVVWWRGGDVCAPSCHSGQTVIRPGIRFSLRQIVRY